MALPRFFDRVADATLPLLEALSREELAARLAAITVAVQVGDDAAERPDLLPGIELSVNLLARLYPSIRLLAPAPVAELFADRILDINPRCDITTQAGPTNGVLSWSTPVAEPGVQVSAWGWNVTLDSEPQAQREAAVPASLAGAAIGAGELFRLVFSDWLGDRGRKAPTPGGFNLVTLEPSSDKPAVRRSFDVGVFHLVGAGAIGEAAVEALRHVGVRGTMFVVDDEAITLPNIQRYVLTSDGDENAAKTDLVARALANSDLEVRPVVHRWGSHPDAMPASSRVVLVAVDSAHDRVAIQSSLPWRVYNAYTQPLDLGWSRHERFGDDPCLGCLYWPDRPRLSEHEVMGKALKQHPLRVLTYLLTKTPVGSALQDVPDMPNLPRPADWSGWLQVSLLDDVAQAFGRRRQEVETWAGRTVSDLYHEGVCAGLLTGLGDAAGQAVVPVAHQSALAGVMLASQLLIASDPDLATHRPAAIEGRYNVLGSPTQLVSLPRSRTPKCLCSDRDFLDRYRSRWQA